MSQIVLQEQTFTQLAHAAQVQQISADELAEQIIREHLRAIERQEMDREVEAYSAQHAEILKKYRDQYIAMYHGEIVDHDIELLNLALRVEERYPNDIVLITQVKDQVIETLTIRSPRITAL